MMRQKKREIPNWAKLLVASVIGAGGIGGASIVPINYKAQEGYNSVREAYPAAQIEVRTWRPYIFKVHQDNEVIVVETSIIDGAITNRW